MPVTKIARLRAAVAANDWTAALSIAAKFPRLGEHGPAITRAHNALLRPDFYRQLGQDPETLVELGKAALIARYRALVP